MIARLVPVMMVMAMLAAACSPVLEVGIEASGTDMSQPQPSFTLPPGTIASPGPTLGLPPFTPIPNWERFVSDRFGVQFQYPAHWQDQSSAVDWIRFGGDDGHFQLAVASVRDNSLVTACATFTESNLYGTAPSLEWTSANGQEACLIIPSLDQDPIYRRQSVLVVRYPQPVAGVISDSPDSVYNFFVLLADDQHIRVFKDTLEFLRLATPPAP